MKVSNITLNLSGSDLLSIIEDFVQIKGLELKKIVLDDGIYIYGSYKKLFRFPFEVYAELRGVKDNTINLKIGDIRFGKIGVFKWAKKVALKMVSKSLDKLGVAGGEEGLQININEILKIIPFKINFNITHLNIEDKQLHVSLEDFVLSLNGLGAANVQALIPSENTYNTSEQGAQRNEAGASEKIEDGYTKIRTTVENKVPQKYEGILEYFMIMPDIGALFFRLFKDKRVPLKLKAIAGGILAYVVFPVDVLPDFIPLIGKIDDMALAFFALDMIINRVPEKVILENWQGKDNIILKVKEGIEYISKSAGETKLGKLAVYLNNLSKEKRSISREDNISS